MKPRPFSEEMRRALTPALHAKTSPLMRVTDSTIEYAQTISEKRALLAPLPDDAVVYFAWAGQWKTDLIEIPVSEARSMAARSWADAVQA